MAAEVTPYNGRNQSKWQRVRARILERDGWRCQIRDLCDGAEATDVDHIKPWRDGGPWYDPDNLRAACGPCNRSRASKQKHQSGWKRADTELVVVTRSAVERIRPEPGDLIVDVERITEALTTGPANIAARQAASRLYGWMLGRLRRGDLEAGRVWIVTDADDPTELPHHSIIDVDPAEPAATGGAPVEPGRW